MFQDIQYLKFEGYHDNLYYTRYLIVDSDFSDEMTGACADLGAGAAANAIINCYSARSLNISLNLAIYHRYLSDKDGRYMIEKAIEWNIQYTPKYKEYAEEVRKYLDRYNNLKVFW